MAGTMKSDTAFKQVLDHAETIRNDQAHDLSGMEIGDEWRQGDLAIIRVDDGFVKANARCLILDAKPTKQLAPGMTQGSRHQLDSLKGVTIYRLKDATPLDGPILHTTEERSILHPEHGDATSLPVGCHVIQYARAFSDQLRAVAD